MQVAWVEKVVVVVETGARRQELLVLDWAVVRQPGFD
jgi:hypothetical protein